jgi:UDP-2,4-diacetamido-2,4,6-trideoxy-beta-L-altropyranose hydrolase
VRKVIFRADGDSVTGLGHIMRSSALMQILENHFLCEFWTKNIEYFPVDDFLIPPPVKKFLVPHLEEAEMLVTLAPKDSIIVLDGYKFDSNYQQTLKNAGLIVICIDDIMVSHFVCDAIINHAGGISKSMYSCENYTQLYLGPEYALVKPIFTEDGEGVTRFISDRKILICLGGADPLNNTEKILDKLVQSSFDQIHVLLGSANLNAELLQSKYAENPLVFFHINLSSREVSTLMKSCSSSVLSPSTICYEYMSIGGIVYLYKIASNQNHILSYLLQNKMAFLFEDFDTISISEKCEALDKQKKVFNGTSQDRLLMIFETFR